MKKAKRLLKMALWIGLLLLIFGAGWNFFVSDFVKDDVFTNPHTIEDRHVGLLLGTSKYVRKGKQNVYYTNRIKAAATLYKLGKIDYVLVSGDNGTVYYNEPAAMLEDLVKAGVPKNCIVQDFAGFRTLDSMVRSKKVFGENKVIVISQKFHVERALFLAKKHNIDAIGFCAGDATAYYGFKTKVREYFARIKMFFDLYILHSEPKFLGEPIQIPA